MAGIGDNWIVSMKEKRRLSTIYIIVVEIHDGLAIKTSPPIDPDDVRGLVAWNRWMQRGWV